MPTEERQRRRAERRKKVGPDKFGSCRGWLLKLAYGRGLSGSGRLRVGKGSGLLVGTVLDRAGQGALSPRAVVSCRLRCLSYALRRTSLGSRCLRCFL